MLYCYKYSVSVTLIILFNFFWNCDFSIALIITDQSEQKYTSNMVLLLQQFNIQIKIRSKCSNTTSILAWMFNKKYQIVWIDLID